MPQSVDLPFTQGMDFGMGVNLAEGGIAGKAVDTGAITSPTGAPGLTVSYNMQIISTVEDLYDSIGVSVAAGGRYGLFSAQGKVQYAKEVKFNSQSTFLLARCFVEKAFRQCEDATLKREASKMLERGDNKGFQERFGDGFVRGMLQGGEFHVVISMASISTTQQEDLAASLQAKYGGLFAEADFDVRLEDKTKQQVSRTELNVTTFQRGGTGPETSLTKDIEGVMARLQAFPAIVDANPVSYGVQVASYRTLDLPEGPGPVAIEAQSDRLSEYARDQVRIQSLRNDVEFMQLHRNFYKEPPPLDRLNAWQEHFGTQLDLVTAQAVTCSRDPAGGCQAFSLQMPEDFARPERTPGVAGLWEMVIFGQGESQWTLSPLEDNKFEAVEEGLGNAKGTAVLTGRKVHLDWAATNPGDPTTGRFLWHLDESLTSADATVQSSPSIRTSAFFPDVSPRSADTASGQRARRGRHGRMHRAHGGSSRSPAFTQRRRPGGIRIQRRHHSIASPRRMVLGYQPARRCESFRAEITQAIFRQRRQRGICGVSPWTARGRDNIPLINQARPGGKPAARRAPRSA